MDEYCTWQDAFIHVLYSTVLYGLLSQAFKRTGSIIECQAYQDSTSTMAEQYEVCEIGHGACSINYFICRSIVLKYTDYGLLRLYSHQVQ